MCLKKLGAKIQVCTIFILRFRLMFTTDYKEFSLLNISSLKLFFLPHNRKINFTIKTGYLYYNIRCILRFAMCVIEKKKTDPMSPCSWPYIPCRSRPPPAAGNVYMDRPGMLLGWLKTYVTVWETRSCARMKHLNKTSYTLVCVYVQY